MHFSKMNYEKLYPTYKPYGDAAILVQWEALMDESTLYNILDFKQKIDEKCIKSISEIIQSNNSLLVIYNNEITNFSELKTLLESTHKTLEINTQSNKSVLWKIPVCYDRSFGIDLQEVSKKLNALYQKSLNYTHPKGIQSSLSAFYQVSCIWVV